MSLRDRLDCLVDFVGMILFCLLPSCPPYASSLPPAVPFTQLFFQSLLSHTLCSRLERFSTANNLANLWCSEIQHVSTYRFYRWDDIFTQKWTCSAPKNLCKCTESPSPLSSNRKCCVKHEQHDKREPGLIKEEFRCTDTLCLRSKTYCCCDVTSNKLKLSSKSLNKRFLEQSGDGHWKSIGES